MGTEAKYVSLSNGSSYSIIPCKTSENVFLLNQVCEDGGRFVLRRTNVRKDRIAKCCDEIDILKLNEDKMKLLSYHHHEIRHDEGKQSLWLVVEFATGTTLEDLLNFRRKNSETSTTKTSEKEGCLDEEEAVIYIIQIVDALSYFHDLKKSLCHGNIRPKSVFILDNRRIKLNWPKLPKNLTDDNPYLAPELLTGSKPDAKSDVWAVGCLTHELLVGRCKNTDALCSKALKVRKQNNLAEFVTSCAQKNKTERLTSRKLKESGWFETWRAKSWDTVQQEMAKSNQRGFEYLSSVWMLFKDSKWPSSVNAKPSETPKKRKATESEGNKSTTAKEKTKKSHKTVKLSKTDDSGNSLAFGNKESVETTKPKIIKSEPSWM